jgi:hypothetical protein
MKPWTDDTLKLRPPIGGSTLRVSLWLEDLNGLPFIAETIRRLQTTAGLELIGVFVTASEPHADPSPAGVAFRFYEKLNRRVAGPDNPFIAVDLRPLLEGIPISFEPPGADSRVDVILSLGLQPRQGHCAGFAHYGVWSLGFGDPLQKHALPLYFCEIQRGDLVTDLVLYVHSSRLEKGRIGYHYRAATRFGWYFASNAIEPLIMAPVILIRRLLDAQQHGGLVTELPFCQSDELAIETRRGYPGLWKLIGFFLRQAIRRSRGVFVRLFSPEAKWFICYRYAQTTFTKNRPRFDGTGFVPIPNPRDSTFADPFLIESENRVYLFFEEIVSATARGHLSVCELRPEGPSEFKVILQKPYHLSYPCVVEWKGEYYMIPECGEQYTLELYRASSFPYTWQFEKFLQKDIALVDTTPFFQEGFWYFFTTTIDVMTGGGLETWLFWSDSLDGDWHYHRANPICCDVRRARSAGHLFRRNGRLIRPSQDCSIRYGYAIVLNEVLKLSPTEYQERVDEVIPPSWRPDIFATHTLNYTPSVEVIDATRIPEKQP